MDYPDFLDAVQSRAGLDRQGAEAAAVATLRALAERVTSNETRDLLAELPKGLQERIPLTAKVEDLSTSSSNGSAASRALPWMRHETTLEPLSLCSETPFPPEKCATSSPNFLRGTPTSWRDRMMNREAGPDVT